jgi:hypothetical protein
MGRDSPASKANPGVTPERHATDVADAMPAWSTRREASLGEARAGRQASVVIANSPATLSYDSRIRRKGRRIETARVRELARQLGAGFVAGITGVIFAMTYGALLFAGPLERFLGYGLTAAFIALAVGSLVGWASREKALIAGADSGSTALLAAALAALGVAELTTGDKLHVALAVVFAHLARLAARRSGSCREVAGRTSCASSRSRSWRDSSPRPGWLLVLAR